MKDIPEELLVIARRMDLYTYLTISDDEKSFEATYFSLNGIPQTNADLYGLIEKVFKGTQDG